MPIFENFYTLLDAESTADTIMTVPAGDFDHVVFSIDTDGGGTANLTVKFTGSIAETKPTTSSAQSVTNSYDFIEVVDLEDGATIDGDTGIGVSGADMHRLVEANINGLKWIVVRLTARSAGTVTVVARLFSRS